jgi:hypothetical protein
MLSRIAALVLVSMLACGRPSLPIKAMTLCDLSKDFSAYRDRLVAVRGVYFYGLKQDCAATCAIGPWPSFVDLTGSSALPDAAWLEVDKAERTAEEDAKHGKRSEVWVTVIGRVRAPERPSPAGPCDPVRRGHYGHLGVFPAQLVVERFTDIQVIPNPNSTYDYGNLYHGAW